MKRYINFHNESWPDRTHGHMQAARWEACIMGIIPSPPCAGVIDALPIQRVHELIAEGWVDVPHAPSDLLTRRAARKAVLSTLADDVDCLFPMEHMLVERMLIGDGLVFLESIGELEAAYTLRMRLWCDIGIQEGQPCARLDKALFEALPELMIRPEHAKRRGLIFAFDGMVHGLLYITGFLDYKLPNQKFIEEVLRADATPATERLSANYLEAAFDCYTVAGCTLLLHEALSIPETLIGSLATYGMLPQAPVTPEQLIGAMNSLLPEEAASEEKLRLSLSGALRPEFELDEVTTDLRLLAKQGAPIHVLSEVMASKVCVLPTLHMQSALLEMFSQTPRWIAPWPVNTTPHAGENVWWLH